MSESPKQEQKSIAGKIGTFVFWAVVAWLVWDYPSNRDLRNQITELQGQVKEARDYAEHADDTVTDLYNKYEEDHP